MLEQTPLRRLYASLSERRRPEDIAELILQVLDDSLSRTEKRVLQKAARNSLKQQWLHYTSMAQEFARPIGLARQICKAQELFKNAPELGEQLFDNPQAVEQFIRPLGLEIAKQFGSSDFKADRLNHQARVEAGLDLSRRRYNKLFRHLMRMERKLETLLREWQKRRLQQVSKSRLATEIDWEQFAADRDTAAFIAYYTACCNLRSTFTIEGQQRPYDEIAAMLFQRCRQSASTCWWAVAQVHPVIGVLEHLDDAQKGALLGRWTALLAEIAGLLEQVWEACAIDRRTMIVRRGNDSTTWNNMAGAWNRARDAWVALICTLGMEQVLDVFFFGKVLRLMAADVAMWHLSAGSAPHPDTAVWNELPLPWEVFSGKVACTRSLVEATCLKHGVDPDQSAWLAPRPASIPAPFRPTPELVHGVEVACPLLATALKQAGYFSGKPKAISSRPPESL